MKRFFGFAVSDSMFNGDVTIRRQQVTVEEVKQLISVWQDMPEVEFLPCLNPSHVATIVAMQERFGMQVEVPATAPRCSLNVGDKMIVMQVRGLPRLDATRHEYTSEEIAQATFTFALWSVLE